MGSDTSWSILPSSVLWKCVGSIWYGEFWNLCCMMRITNDKYNIIVFFEQNMSLNSTHLIMKNCTAYNDWRDFLWQFVMYCEKIKANVYSMVQPSGKEFVFSCNGCLIFRKHFLFFSKNLYVENLNNYFFTFLEH